MFSKDSFAYVLLTLITAKFSDETLYKAGRECFPKESFASRLFRQSRANFGPTRSQKVETAGLHISWQGTVNIKDQHGEGTAKLGLLSAYYFTRGGEVTVKEISKCKGG